MGKDLSKVTTTIYFCDGGSCRKAGSEQVVRTARAYLRNKDLWHETHTIRTRCNGRCEDAPTCIVQSGNYWYKELSADKITRIIESHIATSEPLKSDLIYMDGFSAVQSDKERPRILPKPFFEKEDALWGNCWYTKGFSSDQYLYPLFLYLKENAKETTITFNKERAFALKSLAGITYTDDYKLFLHFDDGANISLNIGAVPKTEPLEEQQNKITSTTYFIVQQTKQRKIRFTNKMGKVIASIHLASNEPQIWNYLLTIQLQGLKDPTE